MLNSQASLALCPRFALIYGKNLGHDPEQLGGERSYIADFEVYDERASDHLNVVLDIYIGIK